MFGDPHTIDGEVRLKSLANRGICKNDNKQCFITNPSLFTSNYNENIRFGQLRRDRYHPDCMVLAQRQVVSLTNKELCYEVGYARNWSILKLILFLLENSGCYFPATFIAFQMRLLQWPVWSSDKTPIDHVRDIVARQLSRRCSSRLRSLNTNLSFS